MEFADLLNVTHARQPVPQWPYPGEDALTPCGQRTDARRDR